jgi:alkylated DNA nucleotide flippase Atl1
MQRWGEVKHPLVKAVAGSAVLLFLALNFPAVFLVIMAGVLLYAISLLGVVGTYRKRYRIIGVPEVAVRFAAKVLENLKEEYDRTVVRRLRERKRRKLIRQEKEERLKRYQRARNRRKREQARRASAER